MLILSIETSCDETSVAVVEKNKNGFAILSNKVSSQIKLHARWGGVIPNLAAREHLKNIISVFDVALFEASVSAEKIDLVAFTRGPGLIPALLIGAQTARTFAWFYNKPIIGIHHIEGHIYANFINKNDVNLMREERIKFPALCLVVSGGHTQLILMKGHLQYEIIGQTLDDAAGEAFDKVARILGLGYPGGPAISRQVEKNEIRKIPVKLPRPMINSNNLNFSFSGLKTAVLYETKKHPDILKDTEMKSALCAEFQQAVIDVLIFKTLKAAEIYQPKTIMLAGGVSANKELRKQLSEAVKNSYNSSSFIIPDFEYCVDNAAMIAVAALFRWEKMGDNKRKRLYENWKKSEADANLLLR